ncbi:MAG TPA: vitamin B12 dependent-methionine synthase activation domain-containing protein, partial [Rhizomicrobium sp.]|nr:vitamin B12 dependent-methionine synthase activation domain-containing protein [Rhizomicrobium sp.]
ANLISRESRATYIGNVRSEYARIIASHDANRGPQRRLTLGQARANRFAPDWVPYAPPKPRVLGTRHFDAYDLADLVPYIDWTPFFHTWEMKGRYPNILEDEKAGPAARALFADAQAMLKRIVDEKWLTARASIGFWPAESEAEDIVVYKDDERKERLAVFHTLRQQVARERDTPNLALADFVAPAGIGKEDYVGAFVVTAGHGEDAIAAHFKADKDDYSAILLSALADRLAEAFAEALHEKVRKDYWGYAADEKFTNDELIKEAYSGIRPAPGYPAQPEHSEKATLFKLLDASDKIGVKLTESYAMWPGSSVSGFYYAHPESRYFGVGKIERDQVEDYARRKGWTREEAERWLAPLLNYNPRESNAA